MPDHRESGAVIAGGTPGLGFAIAERMIADGCKKRVTAVRRVAEADAAAQALQSSGADVCFVACDTGPVEDPTALIDCAVDRFDRATALANAATTTERGSILGCSDSDFDRHIVQGAKDSRLQAAEARQPMGMLVKPSHVAELASFMRSASVGVMTGALVVFDQNVAGTCPE